MTVGGPNAYGISRAIDEVGDGVTRPYGGVSGPVAAGADHAGAGGSTCIVGHGIASDGGTFGIRCGPPHGYVAVSRSGGDARRGIRHGRGSSGISENTAPATRSGGVFGSNSHVVCCGTAEALKRGRGRHHFGCCAPWTPGVGASCVTALAAFNLVAGNGTATVAGGSGPSNGTS